MWRNSIILVLITVEFFKAVVLPEGNFEALFRLSWSWLTRQPASSVLPRSRLICLGLGLASSVHRRLASEEPNMPTAPPMRLPIPKLNPNPNPNPKTHPNPI